LLVIHYTEFNYPYADISRKSVSKQARKTCCCPVSTGTKRWQLRALFSLIYIIPGLALHTEWVGRVERPTIWNIRSALPVEDEIAKGTIVAVALTIG